MQEIHGGICSVSGDDSPGTGWISHNGYLYYFNPADGKMQTGWIPDNGTWCCCDPQGRKCGNGCSPGGRYPDENGVLVDGTQYFKPEEVTLHPTCGLCTPAGAAPGKPGQTFMVQAGPVSCPDGDQSIICGGWNAALPVTDTSTLSRKRNQVYQTAVSLIGTPYLWGGSDSLQRTRLPGLYPAYAEEGGRGFHAPQRTVPDGRRKRDRDA